MQKKILIVDDSELVRGMLTEMLTQHQFGVITAQNGKEAFESVKRESPDLILIDVMMPEMTGYDFVQKLKEQGGSAKEIPVVIMTSRESMKDFFDSWDITDFWLKTSSEKELLARIDRALRSGGAGVSAAPEEDREAGFGMTVLIASPEEFLAKKLKEHFESVGFSVFYAYTEKETVETALKVRPTYLFLHGWEDPQNFNSGNIYRDLTANKSICRTGVVCFALDKVSMDVAKEMGNVKVLAFNGTRDLINQLMKAVNKGAK